MIPWLWVLSIYASRVSSGLLILSWPQHLGLVGSQLRCSTSTNRRLLLGEQATTGSKISLWISDLTFVLPLLFLRPVQMTVLNELLLRHIALQGTSSNELYNPQGRFDSTTSAFGTLFFLAFLIGGAVMPAPNPEIDMPDMMHGVSYLFCRKSFWGAVVFVHFLCPFLWCLLYCHWRPTLSLWLGTRGVGGWVALGVLLGGGVFFSLCLMKFDQRNANLDQASFWAKTANRGNAKSGVTTTSTVFLFGSREQFLIALLGGINRNGSLCFCMAMSNLPSHFSDFCYAQMYYYLLDLLKNERACL